MRASLSVGLADVHTNPVPQNGKGFMYRICIIFILNLGNENAACFSFESVIEGKQPDMSREGTGHFGWCLHCLMLVYMLNIPCKLS